MQLIALNFMKKTGLLILLVWLISCDKESDEKSLEMVVKYQLTRPSGFGKADGSIRKTVSGGTPPYTFSWIKPDERLYQPDYEMDENQDLFNASAGPYILRVLDSNAEILYDTIFLSSDDTILSNPYIAAYPGSYWKYDNGKELYCEDYKKTPLFWSDLIDEYGAYLRTNSGCEIPRDSLFLPFLSLTI